MDPLDPRYARHRVLPEVGPEGQRRLGASSVLIVGAGGLGVPAALYLAAAGVGRLGLVDYDAVDLSNLQRQVLYTTADVGRPKLEAARERLTALNPGVEIETFDTRLSAGNALEILRGFDVVVDGTDNFPARYVANDAAYFLGKPLVHGSIFRFEGQASVFLRDRGPCYRCLFPEPPPAGQVPNCADAGVLGVLPGLLGMIQATEAAKLLLGIGEPLIGRLLLVDALGMRLREVVIARDPGCPLCGEAPSIRSLRDEGEACAIPTVAADAATSISARELKERLDRGDSIAVVDVRSPEEWAICRIDGARLIPMHEIPQRLDEIDRDRELVLYCHVGVRSAHALAFLRRQGFARARHLRGGIEAWAGEVDPAMPRY